MYKPSYWIRVFFRILVLQVIFLLASSGLVLSAESQRFTDNGDGTVTDQRSGLMWAANDNGKDIDFEDAAIYCKSFAAGGFSDWRLPDIEELKALFDVKNKNPDGFGILGKIKLSSCCQWSSYDSTGVSSLIDFRNGKEIWSYKGDNELLRALPVRASYY